MEDSGLDYVFPEAVCGIELGFIRKSVFIPKTFNIINTPLTPIVKISTS